MKRHAVRKWTDTSSGLTTVISKSHITLLLCVVLQCVHHGGALHPLAVTTDPSISLLSKQMYNGDVRLRIRRSPLSLNSFNPIDRSHLFVQMSPALNFDSHMVPAHIVGAYERTPRPHMLSLPSRPLGESFGPDNLHTLNSFSHSMGSMPNGPIGQMPNFENSLDILKGSPLLPNGPPLNLQPPPRQPNEYRGTAQVVDPEVRGIGKKSAMQHVGEGEDEENMDDPHRRTYSNLQDSGEQMQEGHDLSPDTTPVELVKNYNRNQPSDIVDKKPDSVKLERLVKAHFDGIQHNEPVHEDVERYVTKSVKPKEERYRSESKRGRKSRRKNSSKSSRRPPQEEEEIEEEESSPGITLGGGRSILNFQFGGRKREESDRPRKTRRRRPEEDEEEAASEERDHEAESTDERRSFLRMPFRVFRGVSLGRGDDGALAFNINLG